MAEKTGVRARAQEPKPKCSNFCKRKSGYNSSSSSADRVLRLQKTAGNQAVQRLIKSGALQAKLRIGQADDVYEQEADRVAEQVMKIPDPFLQHKCGKCTGREKRILQTRESSGEIPAIQNQSIPPFIHKVLHSSGQPLDSATQVFMEDHLGHDFSRVRVHLGAIAEQQETGGAQIQCKPVAKDSCPVRDPGETRASAAAPYTLIELSPRQEWLIGGFGVGSSKIDPAKGDIADLMASIEWKLAQGHFFYVLGQDPVEVLGYSDCHVSKVTPNEQLRIERASNFCEAYKLRLFDRLGSHKTFNKFVSSCRAAPAGEYATSNATKEGRSQNRGVLIRVLPPSAKTPTSSFPYDEKYGPTKGNCATYLATADFLNSVYAHNAFCACSNTPDEPHNNCVRKCLQSKLWPFLADNAEDLRSGRFIWCPTIWRHHRECYRECMCDRSFIDYVAFAPLCTIKMSCPATGISIALFNRCMDSTK